MKLIGKLIYSHIGMFLTAVLFLTLEAACDLLQPTLMSQVVDEGVKLGNSRTVLFYGGMMLFVAGLGAVGAVMRNICSSRTSQLIGMELRSRLYRKVQSLSFENIDRFQTSSLITRIIARALLKDAPVLILDDCTSALDAFTEKKVLEGIGHLRGRKTIFLISQRVSTVMRADRILCLKEGSLAGFGTHEELLAQCTEYREMYISQMGGV